MVFLRLMTTIDEYASSCIAICLEDTPSDVNAWPHVLIREHLQQCKYRDGINDAKEYQLPISISSVSITLVLGIFE